jgi:arylsulfatase A-like enzyme
MRAPLVLAILLCACGGDDRGTTAAAPARVRLWTSTTATLEETPPTPEREVFAARFDDPEQGWAPVARPPRDPAALAARTETEGEPTFLRLGGTHGGLHAVVPVQPETCYVFSGRVRTNALEYAEGDSGGATFWLGEARDATPLAELVTTHLDRVTATHPLRGTRGTTDWKEHRLVFVTAPGTRFLHVVCSLADEQTVASGSADFAAVRLAEGSLSTFWHDALARETARRRDIDPPDADWQRVRRVSAQLGQEHRPSIVLVPGDRLRFELPALAGTASGATGATGARLTFGVGPWRAAMTGPNGTQAVLRIACDGVELAPHALTVPERAGDAFWEDVELELGPEPRTLELRCEGSAPLVVGGAVVRARVPRQSGPNVLLISIDTLRADHVGAYAEGVDTTPTLDRLARTGVLCRDTSAVSPYTLPSHTTMLTGQLPSLHGVVDHGLALSAARSTSLAEVLARAGYATQAFTAGGFVNAEFGLDRGFDGFAQIDPVREVGSHYHRTLQKRHTQPQRLLDTHGNAGVGRWLRAHADESFFMFVHTYTVHDYDPPERYLPCDGLGCTRPAVTLSTRSADEAAAFTPEMRAHIVHLYDAALRYTDDRIAELLAVLAEIDQAENTLVVVTSDHGEEFFERGSLQHGRTLYEELLRVPLILWGAGLEPRVIERPASLADVTPTVLARLGLPPLEHVQGVDLLGPAWPERYVWAEVDDHLAHLYSLRTERGKKTLHFPGTPGLLFPATKAWEQFDLARDPGEEHDLVAAGQADAALQEALERYRVMLEELGERLGGVARVGTGDATLQELEDLGYGGLGQ